MAKLLLGSVVGPQGPQGTPGVNGSQGPQGIPGPNEVTATTDVVGLTSGQLLYNNGGKVGSVEIVGNLLSVNPNKPLSANQGKVLKGLIDDNGSAIGQLATDRGYLTSKKITTQVELDNLPNGKYWLEPFGELNGGWLEVINHSTATGYSSQFLNEVEGGLKTRTCWAGTWSAWKNIALVDNISNPNLLINGDFQIWQRGTMFERISGKYTADRWLYDTHGKGSGFNGKIEKITNGLKLTQLDGLGMNHRFRYLMEVLESLKGQKLTLTLKYKTNKVFGVSFLGNGLTTVADSNVNTLKATGTYNGDLELFSMATYNNTDTSMFLELYSVKLELGDIATPFSPRSYAEELAMCQRYCATNTIIGLPYLIDTNEIRFFIPLQRFRTTPSLIVGDMAVSANSISQSGFTFDNVSWASNGIYLRAYKVNHGLTSKIVLTSITAIFDAEIY